jgi:single-strand DNA-binding protein
MAYENNCNFLGRLGADPIIRSTQAGDQVANFRIAVNEQFGVDANGNKKEVTTWINGVAWKKLATIMAQYCRKGDMIGLQGRHRNRTWKDQEGNDRYTTEIVADSVKFMPKPGNGNGGNGGQQPATDLPPVDGNGGNGGQHAMAQVPPGDIPF